MKKIWLMTALIVSIAFCSNAQSVSGAQKRHTRTAERSSHHSKTMAMPEIVCNSDNTYEGYYPASAFEILNEKDKLSEEQGRTNYVRKTISVQRSSGAPVTGWNYHRNLPDDGLCRF